MSRSVQLNPVHAVYLPCLGAWSWNADQAPTIGAQFQTRGQQLVARRQNVLKRMVKHDQIKGLLNFSELTPPDANSITGSRIKLDEGINADQVLKSTHRQLVQK